MDMSDEEVRKYDRVMELMREAQKPETTRRLIELLSPKLVPGKRTLVYILNQVERIGQIASELAHIKTLYYRSYDQILIVTGPTNGPGVNPYVFEAVGSRFLRIETANPGMLAMGMLNGGLCSLENMDLLLVDPWNLASMFKNAVAKGKKTLPFELSPSVKQKGREWMRKVGMNMERPIVLLHVRDRGYLPELSHHEYRCADISNYRMAINFLVSKGYQVVRIGDPSNPAIEADNSRIWDLPFHPEYINFLDVYFAAICRCALVQSSGPASITGFFDKPMLMVNRVLDWTIDFPNEVVIFKRHFNRSDGVELSYQEILERGAAEIASTENLYEAGMLVEENTPEELLRGVQEFVDIIDGRKKPNPKIQARFKKLNQKHEKSLRQKSDNPEEKQPLFGLAYAKTMISESFVGQNPNFLGKL
ncbi:MAG: hypothetical protein CMM58_00385 [Rhodospirillaceae bacterium]|nr:hypothetical protein [Rhodospirillaceae bacterium]|tara:strand:+ start:3291 stop:4550 length:1260 start_codon:yes stop_codon:yes gene_type:complete